MGWGLGQELRGRRQGWRGQACLGRVLLRSLDVVPQGWSGVCMLQHSSMVNLESEVRENRAAVELSFLEGLGV